jgi:hypothetical protein
MAGDIIFFNLAGPGTGIYRWFFLYIILLAAKLRWAGLRSGTKYDKYDNKRAALHFRGFFYKTGISRGLYIILITPKGTAKLRWAGWGAEDIIFF